MATSNNNYLGYSTYILGTTKNILGCLEIIVYNKSQLSGSIEKLSLYNITQVYQKVIQSNEYVRIEREDSSKNFNYYSSNGKINGFDTIIYLSNSDNTPTGYTEFINKQGDGRDVSISLAFNSVISGDLVIELSNSLTQLKNNSTVNKNFTGNNLYYFPTIEDIKSDVDNCSWNIPKYTTNVSSLIKSNNKGIFLGYGIANEDYLVKLDISKNITVDPYEIGFTSSQFGYYLGDLVIYMWKDLKYTIYSVTRKNRFGNPISYIRSNTGYSEIPEHEGGINQTIVMFSGKYAILNTSDETTSYTELFDFEKQERLQLDYKFITDPMDLSNKIIKLPNILNYSNVYDYLPEISNIHLNLYEYSRTNSINIVKKTKNWFTLSRTKDGINIFSGLSMTVYFSSEEVPMIINNQAIMVKTIDTDNDLEYYTIYNDSFKTYYSEKARSIIEKGELKYNDEIGILFCTGGSKDNEYLNYYKNKKINIVKSEEKLNNSYFKKFRRNMLPTHTVGIPKIIGVVDGIFFYKNQNYINYL